MEQLKTKDYTKQYITNALIKLMQTKEYSSISVSEITQKAGVGRVTYYRHFNSKEDIIIEYFNRNSQEFINDATIYFTKDEYLKTITKVFETFKSHKEFFILITRAHLEYIYLDYLNKMFVLNFTQQHKTKPVSFAYMYAGCLFNISMQWLKNDFKDSVEEISQSMYNFIFPDTQSLI